MRPVGLTVFTHADPAREIVIDVFSIILLVNFKKPSNMDFLHKKILKRCAADDGVSFPQEFYDKMDLNAFKRGPI